MLKERYAIGSKSVETIYSGDHEALESRVKTILAVDDVKTNRRIMQKYLSRKGYKVITKEDGLEALEYLKNHPVDFIVTDLEMPNMNGLELIQALKSEFPEVYNSKILMVTGAPKELCNVAKDLIGEDNILSKPIDLNYLNQRLDHLL